MVNASDLTAALADALPASTPEPRARLAAVIADLASGALAADELEGRLAAEPDLLPLVRELAGRAIVAGGVRLSFDLDGEQERAAGETDPARVRIRTSPAPGGTTLIDQRQGVAISGGVVEGVVVGFNEGTINYTRVTVNVQHGAGLEASPAPTIKRAPPPKAPLPVRNFHDRAEALDEISSALQPRQGAWLSGALGCGLTAFTRQVANSPEARAFADGVTYVDGALAPGSADDLIQELYTRFYVSEGGETLRPATNLARAELGGLSALFLIDQARVDAEELVALADTLAGTGSVVVAGEGTPPDTLMDLPLGPMPESDALKLLVAESRADTSVEETAPLVRRLGAALGRLPLPLLLAARLVRAEAAPLGQLVAVAEELRSERAPLVRAAKMSLTALDEAERAALAAVVRVGGPDADLDALAATGNLSTDAAEDALSRLVDLRLANVQGGRYRVFSGSLRRVLDKLLAPGEERRRAAAFFAGAAALRRGDMDWLAREWQNLSAAAQFSLEDGNPAQAGALAQAVEPYVVLRGFWGEWGRTIDTASEAAEASGDSDLQAWAEHERGTRAGLLGDLPAAAGALAAALALRRERGDAEGAALTLDNIRYLGLIPPSEPEPESGPSPAPGERQARRFPRLLLLVLAGVLALLAGVAFAAFSGGTPTVEATLRAEPASESRSVDFAVSLANAPADALTYVWDFGDGSGPRETGEPAASHTYAAAGTYSVTLQLRDSRGTLLAQGASLQVSVSEPPTATPSTTATTPPTTARPAVAAARTPMPTRSPTPEVTPTFEATSTLEVTATPAARATLEATPTAPPTAGPTNTPTPEPSPTPRPSPAPVMAIYFPWYEQSDWAAGDTADVPAPPYSGGEDETLRRHFDQMAGAGINVILCVWMGPDEPRTTDRCGRMLALAEGSGGAVRVAYFFDQASPALFTPGGMEQAFSFLKGGPMASGAYFGFQGRPAAFFFAPPALGDVNAWRSIRDAVDPGRGMFWFAGSDQTQWLSVFDTLFFFDVSYRNRPYENLRSYKTRIDGYNRQNGTRVPFVVTVQPGYDDRNYLAKHPEVQREPHVGDRANGDFYRSTWRAARDFGPDAILLATFNEFKEGSYIEPSQGQSPPDFYLQLTAEEIRRYRGG